MAATDQNPKPPLAELMSNVPAEMKERRQWVSRAGKVLMDPKFANELAKTNDPSTWGSHQQAVAHSEKYGLDGVGFVFTKDDPYFFEDLDKHVDPDTGEISPEAAKILQKFSGTYMEWSSSREGVHVVGRGTKTRQQV